MAGLEIITERLVLTPLNASDAATLFEYRSDSDVCRYQAWEPDSPDDALHFINGFQSIAFDTPDTWYQLAVRLRESDLLIGDLGVHFLEADTRQVEIGFTVAPRLQGQGFGVEAVRGLLGYLLRYCQMLGMVVGG